MHKAPLPGHGILVIDDSEVMLARIKKALVGDGHSVTTTTQTVGNARHLASCDLVIIDYHMPGIDGLAVQEQLRGAAVQLEKQPLFYLYTSDPTVVAHAKGFDGCFTNKGDENLLVQQVRAVFRLSQIRAMAGKPRGASAPPVAPPESWTRQSVPPGGPESKWARPSVPPAGPESKWARPSVPPAGPESKSKLSVPPTETTRRKA